MPSIVNYGNKRFASLLKHLRNYHRLQRQETLHRIRVELKKIINLLKLLSYCHEKFDYPKHAESFGKIFKLAGKIRERHVIQELLKEYGIKQPQEPNKIREKAKKQMELFVKKVPEFENKIKKHKRKFLKHLKHIEGACVKKNLLKAKNEFKNKSLAKLEDSELHRTRKIAKQIIYLSRLLKLNDADRTFFTGTEKAMGVWHDKQVVVEYLKKMKPAGFVKIGRELEKRIHSEAFEIKKNISKFYAMDSAPLTFRKK
ncbi:MAG TPA: CHAD domain-containing protein [Bacteroidia bacterium]|jgi:CHAD domain-containing protein|nr:CHAD domain-containing protein [Bacteroidia bacterium]